MTITFTGQLTPEQIAETQAVVADWMRIGLSTDRCDRVAAEAAVHAAYDAAGIPRAPAVIWMDSPLGGLYAKAALKLLFKNTGQLGDQLDGLLLSRLEDQLEDQFLGRLGGPLWNQLQVQLWGQIRNQRLDQLERQLRNQLKCQLRNPRDDQLWSPLAGQLWNQLWNQTLSQLQDQLRDRLKHPLWNQLMRQLWNQLGGQLHIQLQNRLGGPLWDQLGRQLGDQLGRQLGGQLWRQLGGQFNPWGESHWLALYGRALAYAPLSPSPQLDTLTAAVLTNGWWWPMRGAVILTDRPVALLRDQQSRLHNETGPALAYADGYDLYSWHGVTVPADLVIGDGWTPDRILRERNAEIRRCAIEKRGWDRFVHDAGLAQVGPAEADPGNPGQELRLYDLPSSFSDLYDEPARILVCSNASLDRDGTRRTFGLPVPADVPDPVSAAALTFDLGREEYASLARAT